MSNQLLKNVHPDASSIEMFSSNLKNKEKQVIILVDGVSYTLSPTLTKAFRTGDVTADELGDYLVRVIDLKDKDGEPTGKIMNSLGMLGEDTSIAIAWSKKKVSADVTKVDSKQLSKLVAF